MSTIKEIQKHNFDDKISFRFEETVIFFPKSSKQINVKRFNRTGRRLLGTDFQRRGARDPLETPTRPPRPWPLATLHPRRVHPVAREPHENFINTRGRVNVRRLRPFVRDRRAGDYVVFFFFPPVLT